jgi:hypothetical protein
MKRFFGAIWRGWKWFAHKLGVFNTKVLLTITYFIMVGIISIFIQLFRIDLLDRRFKKEVSLWREHEDLLPDLEHAKRQF